MLKSIYNSKKIKMPHCRQNPLQIQLNKRYFYYDIYNTRRIIWSCANQFLLHLSVTIHDNAVISSNIINE